MIYDLIIIGAGPAGISAAKIAIDSGLSVLLIERGKDISKRKDLISGWFGRALFNNINLKSSSILSQLKIKNNKSAPILANNLFNHIDKKANILFNTEVLSVEQNDNLFIVETMKTKYSAKKCLISTGKHSIEWIKELYNSLNLSNSSYKSKIGVRIDVPSGKFNGYLANLNTDCVTDVKLNSFIGEWEDSDIISACGYVLDKKSSRSNFMAGVDLDLTIDDILREVKIINILAMIGLNAKELPTIWIIKRF